MSIRFQMSNRGDGERCSKFLGKSVDTVGSDTLEKVNQNFLVLLHTEVGREVSSKGGAERRVS